MKHNIKITIIILSMFLLTQFIGLYVVNTYSNQKIINGEIHSINATKMLPYGMEIPKMDKSQESSNITSLLISFIIAIAILFLLTHIKAKFVLKTWYLFVTAIALGISFNAIIPPWQYASWISLAIAIPFAYQKVYARNFISHNFTELLVYPGIAAIFVPLLTIKTIIILLLVICGYDAWAVWKSKIMQKMARYQMDELKIFSGFYIPYVSKAQRAKIHKIPKKDIHKKGIKVNVAILGGGDIIFPIIAAGVVLRTWGVYPAIAVIFGALLGLGLLLSFSKKKKFYPAMPFISAGIFLAMGISRLLI